MAKRSTRANFRDLARMENNSFGSLLGRKLGLIKRSRQETNDSLDEDARLEAQGYDSREDYQNQQKAHYNKPRKAMSMRAPKETLKGSPKKKRKMKVRKKKSSSSGDDYKWMGKWNRRRITPNGKGGADTTYSGRRRHPGRNEPARRWNKKAGKWEKATRGGK